MGSEFSPELIYGQEFYVPATANYYQYDCTGAQAPAEWDDHHTFLGSDGQDLNHSGMHTEGSQYVYYATPEYGYAHSSYNPYPSDSSFGLNGSFVGAQEYLADPANPTYHQTVAGPANPAHHQTVADHATPAYHQAVANPANLAYHQAVADPSNLAYHQAVADPTNLAYRQAVADPSNLAYRQAVANPPNPAYHQTVSAPYYGPVLPSTTDNVLVSSTQPLLYTSVPFFPSKLGEAVKVTNPLIPSAPPFTSRKGVGSTPSLQSTIVSSKQFQDPVKPQKAFIHSSFPVKQQFAGEAMVPANRPHATQELEQLPHGRIPFAERSTKTNGYVGSDLRKCVSAEKFQPSSKSSSIVNGASRRSHLSTEQHLNKASRARGQRTSAIVVESYSSKLRISNPEGKIVIRTDEFNRDDFRVEYHCAKFFVIKSFNEDDIHKSVKYGVWSSTTNGNKKLNSAYEDAQQLSMKNSIECPVFLFFSANGTGHFCGVAEMVGPVDFERDMDFWHQDKWSGSFPVTWHIIKDVPNSTLRQIILENNENRPVTHSRDTQEIPYAQGTNMLKIFKEIIVKECLLDDFIRYEEAEADNSRSRRSKLSHNAPVFIPVSCRAHTAVSDQPQKEHSVLADIVKETHDLTEKLQETTSLNDCQDLHMKAGGKKPISSASQPAKGTALKESHSVRKQDHDGVVKTATVLPTTGKTSSEGKQQYWKKVEVTVQDGKHPGAAAHVPSQACEKNPDVARNALAPAVSGTTMMNHGEEEISTVKIGSLSISSGISGNSSSCSDDVVTIGSMPVRVKKSLMIDE